MRTDVSEPSSGKVNLITVAPELVDGARFEAKLHKSSMEGVPHWTARQYGYYSTHRAGYDGALFLVDVSDHWDKKIEAVKAYESQMRNVPGGGGVSLVEKVEIAGRYFGQCAGVRYAEPFTGYEPICVGSREWPAEFFSC